MNVHLTDQLMQQLEAQPRPASSGGIGVLGNAIDSGADSEGNSTYGDSLWLAGNRP
jgi:hypothetical protein